MQRVLIIGAGGHAQVIADILLRAQAAGQAVHPIGYLDDNPALHGQHLLDIPVLGSTTNYTAIPHDAMIVGIGANSTRRRIFERLQQQGEHIIVARHPSAILAPDVQVGPGTVIAAGVIVNVGSTIGTNVILNTGCTIDHHNRIGDHAHIAPGTHLGGDVHIGTETLVGIGAIVMPQQHVGTGSIVGAGALVSRHLPDHVVALGLPARVVKHLSS